MRGDDAGIIGIMPRSTYAGQHAGIMPRSTYAGAAWDHAALLVPWHQYLGMPGSCCAVPWYHAGRHGGIMQASCWGMKLRSTYNRSEKAEVA